MAERMKMSEMVERVGELAKETQQLENLLQATMDDYFEGMVDSLKTLEHLWVHKSHKSEIWDGIQQLVGSRIERNFNEIADVLRAAGWTEPPPVTVDPEKETPF